MDLERKKLHHLEYNLIYILSKISLRDGSGSSKNNLETSQYFGKSHTDTIVIFAISAPLQLLLQSVLHVSIVHTMASNTK